MACMSKQHLDPAKSVIAKIGVEKVSEVTGKHVSRVYRWMSPKEKGGTGGFIPPEDAKALLAWARGNDVPLSPAEFLETLAPEQPTQVEDAA